MNVGKGDDKIFYELQSGGMKHTVAIAVVFATGALQNIF
jgi:hypothetical protein